MKEKRWLLKWVGHNAGGADVYVSADSAKSHARDLKRWLPERKLTFQIFDPQGAPYQHTVADGSWRLRWLWSTGAGLGNSSDGEAGSTSSLSKA